MEFECSLNHFIVGRAHEFLVFGEGAGVADASGLFCVAVGTVVLAVTDADSVLIGA